MKVLMGWTVAAGLVVAAVPAHAEAVPRPPGLIPHVASRSVPVPRAAPLRAEAPAAASPGEAGTAPPITGTIGETRPAPQPTQAMPPVQGLE